MVKTLQQSISLKLRGLADSTLGRVEKIPQEIDERSLKVIENTRSKGCCFSGTPRC
jgi:hypothetical protein